ncbi:MAG TPA: S8 family serine peptidase [Candidatus Paceibacterota bacterium]|nr:S8 family serine peptidase [Candidatus Paceibacterota bacterium]
MELQSMRTLAGRPDVEFAELDCFERRESFPDDPLFTNQWHHQILGSVQAWAFSQGQSFVRIAIVDTPFQMDHPDLAPHVVNGWDADQNIAVTNSSGIARSTLCAGLAAAVINNNLGIAGMGNCTILPININGSISEMYDAVI